MLPSLIVVAIVLYAKKKIFKWLSYAQLPG